MVTIVQNITDSPWGNSDYLICDQSTELAVAVDPWDMGQLRSLAEATGCRITSIFITHSHRDHIAGTKAYLASLTSQDKPLQIFCHEIAVKQISGSTSCVGGELLFSNNALVVSTPGHRPEHLSLYIKSAYWRRNDRHSGLSEISKKSAPVFLAGDCLFDAGIGNCSNGGDIATLFETVSTSLMKLPKQTFIFPGHDYRQRNLTFAQSIEPMNPDIAKAMKGDPFHPSTIGEQLLVNPFFRFNHTGLSAELEKRSLPRETEFQRFGSLRTLRDSW